MKRNLSIFIITILLFVFGAVISRVLNTQSDSDIKQQKGIISGSVTYPSEIIPGSLEVCAYKSLDGDIFECTDNIIEDDRFVYGFGYELDLTAGTYYLAAALRTEPQIRAWHNNYISRVVLDGQTPDVCSNLSLVDPVEITVLPGQISEDIVVGDWYYSSSEVDCHTQ